MKHRTGYLYKRGKVFWLQYTIEGRVVKQSLGTRDAEEAEEKRKKIMLPFMATDLVSAHAIVESQLRSAEAKAQTVIDDAHPPLAVSDAWDIYLKSPNRPDSGPVTLDSYALQWESFARWLTKEYPDAKQLREVSKEIAEEYAMYLTGRGITPNTFNKHVCLCEMVFRVLKDKARIIENPFSGIQRKRLATQHHRELSTEELIKVCQSATGELRSMLALGLYLGARLGDAVMMEWGCVDLIKRQIRYTPKKTARRSGVILTVPMHPVLFNILIETPAANRKGLIHPKMAALYLSKGAYAVSNIIRDHFEKCGIQTSRPGMGVYKVAVASFHSLRHSAVSLLREAGAPLSVTMAIVGHSTVAVHDTYSHAGEAALKQAVASLPAVIGDLKPIAALPARKAMMIEAEPVRALAKTLSADTWQKVQKQLLKLTKKPKGDK